MGCKPPVSYADPHDVSVLEEPLRSRVAQAIADAPDHGLMLVSGLRTPYQQWLLRHVRVPAGHECDPAYKGHPVTALPGVQDAQGNWISGSKHQRGQAADMGGRAMAWFRQRLADYGLALTVPSENWHVEARGVPRVPIKPFGSHPARPGVWKTFKAGDTDESIVARGGLDNEVSEVQIRLKKLGFYTGAIDGDYGPKSQAAIVAFKRHIIALQKAQGKKPWPNADSKVGKATLNMLRWWTA